jgi:hypothetical protein
MLSLQYGQKGLTKMQVKVAPWLVQQQRELNPKAFLI